MAIDLPTTITPDRASSEHISDHQWLHTRSWDMPSVAMYGAKANDPTFDNRAAFSEAITSGRRKLFVPKGTYYFLSKDVANDCCILLNSRVSLVGESSGASVLVAADGLSVDSVIKIDLSGVSTVNPFGISDLGFVSGTQTTRAVDIYNATHFALRDCYISVAAITGIGVQIGRPNDDTAGLWMGDIANNIIIGPLNYVAGSYGIKSEWAGTGINFKSNRVQRFAIGMYANRLYYSTVDGECENCGKGFEFSLARSIRAFIATEHCPIGAEFRATTADVSGSFTNCGDADYGVLVGEKLDEPGLANNLNFLDLLIQEGVGKSLIDYLSVSDDLCAVQLPHTYVSGLDYISGRYDRVHIPGCAISPNGTLYRVLIGNDGTLSTQVQ